MKKTVAKILTLYLVAAAAQAQTKPQAKPAAKSVATQANKEAVSKPAEPVQEVLQPFSLDSLSSGKIDPNFQGASPASVIAALERTANLEKGEFESTLDFNNRKAAALSKKIIGNTGVNDLIPFVAKVLKYHECQQGIMYGYNADTSQVSFYLEPKPEVMGARDYQYDPGSESPKSDTLELTREYEKNRTYTASNAYGATMEVVETKGVIYVVAANRMPFIPGARGEMCKHKSARYTFQMEPAVASQELPSLKALIVMKLNPPYLKYSFYHKDPTRDNPKELNVQTKAVYGDVAKIVIYSGNTGQIYGQFPETSTIQSGTN